MGFRSAFLDWRNRKIASPAFQRWAARFPLTRGVARKKAAETFDLAAGFVYSQVLAACVDIDLFRRLEGVCLTVEELSDETGLPPVGMERLLKAAAALKLIRKREGETYGLGERGAALLGNPSVFAMVRHHRALYADLADPLALLRARRSDTELARYWAYADSDRRLRAGAAEVTPYSELMAATQEMIAMTALDAFDISGHRMLMDVGGGSGAFLTAAAARVPELRLRLVDLPPVAELARDRFRTAGLAHRAEAIGQDMFASPLPAGADLISLNRILHDHDDEPVASLLASVRRAISPGGTLMVIEPMAGTAGAEPMGDAYFGLYLWAMGSGRPRTADELKAMLRTAGFTRIREAGTAQPLLTRVLVAEPVDI